ncbi:hypothetical protein HY501_03450 [Candidatus Woesearchaeota archaeon]|nr:hypothetical protein [Candidatus Woesearchaeota archaeon]
MQKEKGVDWRQVFSWKRVLIVLTVIVFLSFVLFSFGFIKKTCDTEECFIQSLETCSSSKYVRLQNLNYYRYTVRGYSGDKCVVDIELRKMAEGTPEDKVALFEGKGMKCAIPEENIQNLERAEIEKVLNYCTGPLKEAMYQVIIEKLYTLVIANLGEVIGAIEDTLKAEV